MKIIDCMYVGEVEVEDDFDCSYCADCVFFDEENEYEWWEDNE